MNTKTISQTVIITGASPHELYEIFMDEKKHAELINSTAKVSREIGGRFEIYDEYIDGTNIELVQDKKIVQNWQLYFCLYFRVMFSELQHYPHPFVFLLQKIKEEYEKNKGNKVARN